MYHLDMSASHTTATVGPAGAAPPPIRPAADGRYLYQIINTVSSTLDLDRVLRAIVDLISEAIDCHACFIYFVEPSDGSLVLRAVSEPYGALVGRLRFEPGEGLAGWVAKHNQPVFLPEGGLTDPRVKVVPEAEEEKYQSLVAVPLTDKSAQVIGVIALHAEAPREFTHADSDFLMHSASLVAGAIENARLYQGTRRRLALAEGLADLARAVAAAATLADLLPAVAKRAHKLLSVDACQLYVLDPAGGREMLCSAWPPDAAPPRALSAQDLGVELARRTGAGARLAATLWGPQAEGSAVVLSLVAADELVGFLALRVPRGGRMDAEEREIAASIAGQTAVAIKKVDLIQRLEERNAIKDLLEDLAHANATPAELQERAQALGSDLTRPHVVLQAVPRTGPSERSWDEVAGLLESSAARAFPGSLFDRRDAAVRGLLHLGSLDERAAAARLREIHAGLNSKHALAIGLSQRCVDAGSFTTGFEEAEHAVTAAAVVSARPGVISFDDLGAYKYLLRVSQEGRVRDPRGEALKKLVAYDERHRSQLLYTLEEFLKRRGNIAAAAQTLYVHPNTLRQRLRRIQDLTGLDVANEDWLMIEIELKLLRLEHALGRPA
jgi:sugar diacid utilization regulator/putative methionine-R-sulfoxide reductase with GAF domain